MTNKVWDILPPESPTPPPLKVEEKEETPKREVVEIEEKLPKQTKIKWGWFLIFLFLMTVFIFSFRVSKAEIRIWPETETVTFQTELAVNTNIKSADFESKIIPGEFFETKQTISETFPSSGETLNKAEGVIRLYNAYGTKSEEWLEGTRFMSSEGKMFKSKDKISVPGAEIKDGEISPKYVDVPVEAAEPGEDYNIGPSHFSIVAFKTSPTSRYTDFYGESSESMKGGGEATQVTEEDIKMAEEATVEKAKEESLIGLENKISDEFIFLQDAVETEILDKFCLAEAGEETEEFSFRVEAESVTIVFKKEDVENFAKSFIRSQLPEKELLYENSLKISYTAQVVNLKGGKIILSLNFLAKAYPESNLDVLKKGLIGKSLAETKTFLENYPGIMKAEVKFQPFWIKTTPKDLDKTIIDYPIID